MNVERDYEASITSFCDFERSPVHTSARCLASMLGDARRAQHRAICAPSMLGKQILARRAEPRTQKICSPNMPGG
uniref:Uncharacterized protein n=1 Tax=Romanomermis culicivorax TaxID=13658 RepID=A0A915IIS2_ROMCU